MEKVRRFCLSLTLDSSLAHQNIHHTISIHPTMGGNDTALHKATNTHNAS